MAGMGNHVELEIIGVWTRSGSARRAVGVSLLCFLGAGCMLQPSLAQRGDEHLVKYLCSDGDALEMRFYPAQDRAQLVKNGERVQLHAQRTASGFLYTDPQHSVRGRGDELILEIAGMPPLKCTAKD